MQSNSSTSPSAEQRYLNASSPGPNAASGSPLLVTDSSAPSSTATRNVDFVGRPKEFVQSTATFSSAGITTAPSDAVTPGDASATVTPIAAE